MLGTTGNIYFTVLNRIPLKARSPPQTYCVFFAKRSGRQWVEEFLNNRTFRVKFGDHHSSESAVKSGVPQGSVPGPLLFLIFINNLTDELTCNHSFLADDVKLIAPRSQQHELRSSIRQAFNWSHRWDLPINASKSHYLSIGGTPDLRIALSEEAAGKSLQKCENINDLGITVNAAFTPSANVLAAANKARRMLYFIKRSFTCLTKEIFVPLYSALVRPHLEYAIQANCPCLKKDINHPERIQRASFLGTLSLPDQKIHTYKKEKLRATTLAK